MSCWSGLLNCTTLGIQAIVVHATKYAKPSYRHLFDEKHLSRIVLVSNMGFRIKFNKQFQAAEH